jgi:hypothetical protein
MVDRKQDFKKVGKERQMPGQGKIVKRRQVGLTETKKMV